MIFLVKLFKKNLWYVFQWGHEEKEEEAHLLRATSRRPPGASTCPPASPPALLEEAFTRPTQSLPLRKLYMIIYILTLIFTASMLYFNILHTLFNLL